MRTTTACGCLVILLLGCSDGGVMDAVHESNIPSRESNAAIASDADPFVEPGADGVELAASKERGTNKVIRLDELTVVVGICIGIEAKNGAIAARFEDGSEKIISMNGPWPESVQKLSRANPGKELGAEVRGVVATIQEDLYFKDPQVLQAWLIPANGNK